MSPVIDIQRRLMQVGRVRLGEKGPKGEPKKLSTFRFTSASRSLLEKIADRYGGKVSEWRNAPDEGFFQVTTKASEIDIVLPPAYSEGSGDGPRYSQWYELWKGPECVRRCDGETDALSGKPCFCAAAGETGADRTCEIVTRISFLLPGSRVGLWRLDSRGYYAAVESTAILDVLRDVKDPVPARLRIEQRSVKRNGQTRRFIVPVLEFPEFEVPELAPGESMSLAINAPRPAPPKPSLPPGPATPEDPSFERDSAEFGQPPPLPEPESPSGAAGDSAEESSASTEDPSSEAESVEPGGAPDSAFDPVEAAGQFKFTRGNHAGESVSWVHATDRPYLDKALAQSPNEKLKAAITTWVIAKEEA